MTTSVCRVGRIRVPGDLISFCGELYSLKSIFHLVYWCDWLLQVTWYHVHYFAAAHSQQHRPAGWQHWMSANAMFINMQYSGCLYFITTMVICQFTALLKLTCIIPTELLNYFCIARFVPFVSQNYCVKIATYLLSGWKLMLTLSGDLSRDQRLNGNGTTHFILVSTLK